MTYGWWQGEGSGHVELCDECGFDSRPVREPGGALAAAFDELSTAARHPDADRRPAAEVWSGAEYADHCVTVTGHLLGMVASATGRPPTVAPADLESARAAVAEVMAGLTDDEYATVVPEDTPLPVTVGWAVLHLLHDLRHHVLDVRRGLARLAMTDLPRVHAYERHDW